MNKKMKRIISVILCTVMLITAVPVCNAFAAERETVANGYCGADGGTNLEWTLYSDGECVISGTGEMDWYYVDIRGEKNDPEKLPPWYGYYDKIKVITVSEGVESIGSYAFADVKTKYHRVNLPLSLRYMEACSHIDTTPFANIERNQGQIRVLCYPGEKTEFFKVTIKLYEFKTNRTTGEINRTVKKEETHSNLASYPYDEAYYNGEEPELFCELRQRELAKFGEIKEPGVTKKYYIRYYAAGREDISIAWRTEGDAFDAVYYEDTGGTGLITAADFTSARYGYYYVTADVTDSEGNVLATSDTLKFRANIREDMTFKEKVEDFFVSGYQSFQAFIYMMSILMPLLWMSVFPF